MERNIDTGQWNGGESALQLDVALTLLQLFGLGEARVDDVAKHLLHLLDSELLGQLE